MTRGELRGKLEQLANLYRLRHDEAEDRFLGIHRGIGIDASEADGVITLVFGRRPRTSAMRSPRASADFGTARKPAWRAPGSGARRSEMPMATRRPVRIGVR